MVALVLLLTIPPSIAVAQEDRQGRGWAVDATVGTLGIGADLSRSIVPRVLNIRAGASFFSFTNDDFIDNDIHYEAELKLGAIPIAVDVFPFKNWFRLGGGVAINFSEIDGTALPQNGFIEIGNGVYPSSVVGQLNAKFEVNRVSPYFGMGFNNPIKGSGRLGFFVDLGFLYHGTPSASLTSSNSALLPILQQDINRQIQIINDEIKGYKILPVVQLGISYRF